MRRGSQLWVLALAALAVTLTSGAGDAGAEGTRTLYLIRHGQYDYQDPRDPEVGKGLIDLGREQAALVGDRLAALPVQMTSLLTSPMTRARQTAAIMAERFPDLEVETVRDIAECTPPTYRKDIMERDDLGDFYACRDQFERAFKRLFDPPEEGDAHEIVVFHGNAIRYLLARAIGLDAKAWLNMSIGNCSITEVLVMADGSVKLMTFSDVGHLPPAKQTFAGFGQRYVKEE